MAFTKKITLKFKSDKTTLEISNFLDEIATLAAKKGFTKDDSPDSMDWTIN